MDFGLDALSLNKLAKSWNRATLVRKVKRPNVLAKSSARVAFCQLANILPTTLRMQTSGKERIRTLFHFAARL